MNSRRRLLQFLGLGSLFAASGGVTLNQARAAKGMEAISPGFISDPKLLRYPGLKRHTKYLSIDCYGRLGGPRENRPFAQIIEDAERDGWEFITVAGVHSDQFIFRRTEWVDA